jgi:hypothetical protein
LIKKGAEKHKCINLSIKKLAEMIHVPAAVAKNTKNAV